MNTPTTCPCCNLAPCKHERVHTEVVKRKPEAPAREWWVSTDLDGKPLFAHEKPFVNSKMNDPIHVIEYAAFEQLRRERDEAWDCVTETKKRSSDRALEIDRLRAELAEAKEEIALLKEYEWKYKQLCK